jgi:EAL domain-containing protein (putative c-di-GMP-specific phosphodiesterase class I)
VIAEGVEELKQIKIVREIGCESVQGYLFSEPVPAEEIPKLLERNYLG